MEWVWPLARRTDAAARWWVRALVVMFLVIPTAMSLDLPDADAQTVTASGWLTIVWGDGPRGSGRAMAPLATLTEDSGARHRLAIDAPAFRASGGLLALNRRRVSVTGQWSVPSGNRSATRGGELRVTSIAAEPARSASQSATRIAGAHPWVTILCRFSDSPAGGYPPSYFDTMITGAGYPSVNHFWGANSAGAVNFQGSVTLGWYTLPHTRDYYVYDVYGDGDELDFETATPDCIGNANPYVDFSKYDGINLMFDRDIGCCAYGGPEYLTLDGQSRAWAMTWMPPWGFSDHSVLAHEMGHGFGLAHSSGPYGNTYDSWFDVMSGGGRCSAPSNIFGCVGVQTIAWHRDLLGWIEADRRLTVASGTSAVAVIERGAESPRAPGRITLAVIPIGGSRTHFYSVEARTRVGYDIELSVEGVVIHEVDTTRAEDDRFAQVVDGTWDGNPNDWGAAWTPGETFADPANNIRVAVHWTDGTAYQVSIANGTALPPPPAPPTPPPAPTPTGTPLPAPARPSTSSPGAGAPAPLAPSRSGPGGGIVNGSRPQR
ncbi:MAG: hypothetical protein U0821_13155 [Chloroflexota bacterium]